MRKMSVVMMALLFVGMACSSNESPTVEQSQAPTASEAASPEASGGTTKTFTSQTFTLELEADNEGSRFYFNPQFIKAPGGSTVTISFKNEGSVEHNFSMDSPKADHDLEPGKSATFTLKLGAETRYDFYCKYHKSSGMTGAFELH